MNRIWNFFLDHYRFTLLLLITLTLLGFFSVLTLPKESAPEVIVPIGVVSTPYAGAGAEDVETLVTDEIEQEIEDLDDLDSFTSTSREGVSSIVVEFDANADINDRISALKDAVDDSLSDLPEEVDRPNVQQVSISDEPIMILSISAELSNRQKDELGDLLKDDLEGISGVSEIGLSGIPQAEIQVIVDPALLEQYEVSLLEVTQAIQNHDAQFPVGSLEQQDSSYSVRIEGGVLEGGGLSTIPVAERGGIPVYLSDVASISDAFVRTGTYSRLSLAGQPAASSIGLEVFKQDGADLLEVVGEIEARLDALKETHLAGAEIFISFSMGEEIRNDLSNLLRNGLQTILIVFLLLYLLLGRGEALLAGLSIPLTFLMTFIVLSIAGFTINFLTLFSLILALGILVDATIVMVEGMHGYLHQGKSPLESARLTIKQFQWPVMSGIFTTVSAFFPMVFASGVTGQYIRTIPVTVSTVLLCSLFVALAIMPLLGSRFLKDKGDESQSLRQRVIEHFHTWYKAKLEWFLKRIWVQRGFMFILTLAFVGAMSLPFLGILEATLFPAADDGRFSLTLEAPEGTLIERTNELSRQIEEVLYEDERIVSFATTVGSAGGQSATSGGSNSSHIARFSVNLNELEEREGLSSVEIVEEYRKRFEVFAGADISVSQRDAGPPTGAPVEITFAGAELDELARLLREGEKVLESIEGSTGIERSIKETPPEFAFRVRRAEAAEVGLSPLQIVQYLRTALFGTEATTIKRDGEDVEVQVRLDFNRDSLDPHQTQRVSIDDLQRLTIPAGDKRIPLSALLDTGLQSRASSIEHEEGDRISKLTAYTEPDVTTQRVVQAFQERESELQMQPGYEIRYGGETEDVNESFNSMYRAMIIGVFLILAILVLQFNSFRQPFFILASLPFALIGVLPGLALVGEPLSFPAFIGVVALVGIVVNDAIILIDQINVNRRAGMSKYHAVVDGATSRLQPIILTTLTTVAGILPLTLSEPVWGPLGFSIIFGIMFATVLTLIIVPMLYNRFAAAEID